MSLFQKAKPEPTWEEQYPYTVVLRTVTEAEKTRLFTTLARAVALLAQTEPTNDDAAVVYANLRPYLLPTPARPRAANIVQFPTRRTS
jgi:hypothetical protein